MKDATTVGDMPAWFQVGYPLLVASLLVADLVLWTVWWFK